ncbi:tRNA-splicing endonuclease subunit Sen2-2 [Abeliophyllum distichum]|uniref:tRNA-intron lyase n=1 Tax=Abeliophyllum distichum TaxID=126358 RepID=A0ABD1QBV4_9LAMI
MGIRWKGKGAEAKALADPMSKIVSQLKYSLIESDSRGLLSGFSVLIEANEEQTGLLNRTCFGRPIITTEKDKQWFQLSMEEAFYLSYMLKCIKVVGEDNCPTNDDELWKYAISKRNNFPNLFKAYSHLRMKNWVVRAGSQYGVDFVAYPHHPTLVHSEYAVLILSVEDDNSNGRLRVWSDFQCTLRLCGSVAKTLLVLHIDKNGSAATSPSCLKSCLVEERTVTRWNPEQSRENQTTVQKEPSNWFDPKNESCLTLSYGLPAKTLVFINNPGPLLFPVPPWPARMATCCRERAVLVAVYVERPRRRLPSSNYQQQQHFRQANRAVGGRRYDRRAELLEYARDLRTSARSRASSPVHSSSHIRQPRAVQAQRKPRRTIVPTCLGNWKLLLPSFLTSMTATKTSKMKKKNKNRNSVSTISKVVKRLQKKKSFFSKLFAALWEHR